jgi:hypothetical protein
MLFLYAFVLVVRAPWILFAGRVWAEEGTIFLQYAWTHSIFDSVLCPHAGYCNLVANVAGIVGAHVPLEVAPSFMTTIALLVQMIPAALVLFSSIPGLETPARKGIAVLLLLVVPTSTEVYLATINQHFVLCAATGLVLVSTPGGLLDRLCKRCVLLLGGLSGVVSTFLAPFFWLRWWRGRQRELLVQASILTVCALLQVVFIARAVSGEERPVRFNPTVVAGAAYAKFIATPMAPTRPAILHLERLRRVLEERGILPDWVWLVTLAGFAAFLALCWFSGNRTAVMLGAATLWLVLLATPGSREAATEQRLTNHLTGALRYYYAPELFFFLALLIASGPGSRLPRWARTLGGVWVAAVLLMGLLNFVRAPMDWSMFFFGPPWEPQVEQWHHDPSKPLILWPAGREVILPPKP